MKKFNHVKKETAPVNESAARRNNIVRAELTYYNIYDCDYPEKWDPVTKTYVTDPNYIPETCIELSPAYGYIEDDFDVCCRLRDEFEEEFPDIVLYEESEGMYTPYFRSDKSKTIDPDELKKIVKSSPNYTSGGWGDEDEDE